MRFLDCLLFSRIHVHAVSLGRWFIGLVLGLAIAGNGWAGNLDCGQPVSAGTSPTATDALFILKVAVGSGDCDLCVCDTDDSGATTASDALRTLNRAVGTSVEFTCPNCSPVSLCDDLTAIDTSANTFDRIDIGNVSGEQQELWAILTPEVGQDGAGVISIDADGDEQLIVPLHPSGDASGGNVTVAVTNGDEVCPIGSLSILPLPEAPADTSANVLSSFLALVDDIAANFGLTGADLATTPLDQLPSALIPLALIQITLDGPNNENSLAAILDGTAPVLEGELDVDLLNRLVAGTGLLEALEELVASRNGLIPGQQSIRTSGNKGRNARTGGCLLASAVEFEIEDADQLRALMEEGQGTRDGQSSLGNQVVTDAIGNIFNAIGVVFSPARTAGTTLLYSWALHQRWLGELFPTHLTDIQFEIESGGRIPEDRLECPLGGTAALPVWGSPQLFAKNNGIELTQTAAEDLYNFLSFLPLRGLDDDPSAQATLDAANEALESFGQAGCVNVSATTWGPISGAFNPDYIEPLFFGDSVTPGPAFGEFTPVELGVTQLRLRTTDVFSGAPVSREKDIEIVRKRVTMQAPLVRVVPGDPAELIARLSDTCKPEEFEWEYPAFLGEPISERINDSDYKLSFTTPIESERYPFSILGRSTSMELPPDTPKREDTAIVDTEVRVVIDPPGGCVQNGSTLDLLAVVTGLSDSADDRVAWNHSGAGTLDPGQGNTAVYTAPLSGEGSVSITAILMADPDARDEISLNYGPCTINLDQGWRAEADTDDPDLPVGSDKMESAYKSVLPLPGEVLEPPAQWWNGSSHTASASASSTYIRPIFDYNASEISLTASSDVEAQLTSNSGGHAEQTMSWNTSAECRKPPGGENIYCSESTMAFDWNPVFWIEIEETGTYEARLTMSCTRSGSDGLFAVGLYTNLKRHIDRAASGSSPNFRTDGPKNIDSTNPFDAPPPTAPFPFGSPAFVCEPGTDIVSEATWELHAPTDPSESHMVALSIALNSYMVSPLQEVGVTPPIGNYEQSGTITTSVSITKVGP